MNKITMKYNTNIEFEKGRDTESIQKNNWCVPQFPVTAAVIHSYARVCMAQCRLL